jgi:hypothetical protein
MSFNSKSILASAIFLGTVTLATAASNHPVRHHRIAVERQMSGVDSLAYDTADHQRPYRNSGYGARRNEPSYIAIQSQNLRTSGVR